MRTLFRVLGGPALLAMGVLDSSLIPTPGGQDVLVVVLTAAHRDRWLYYAAMGTGGALLGGAAGYWMGRRGGDELLERTLAAARRERLRRAFARFGAGAVFFAALMPPPVPIGPFLLTAGALRYPLGRFCVALAAARALRYTLVAYLASRYGRSVFTLVRSHYYAIVGVLLGAAACATAAAVVGRRRR